MRKAHLLLAAAVLWGCTEDNDSATPDLDGNVEVDGSAGGAGGADMSGAGGMGGVGGMGGAGGADMSAAGGMGGEGGAADPCPALCERFADCAQEICTDLADRGFAVTTCLAGCAANPSFAPVAGGTETCNDLVAFGRQTLDPSFGERCVADPLNPPSLPECDAFGAQIAECLVLRCPATASAEGQLDAAYTSYCNQAAAMGELNPMDAAALAGLACENPTLAGIIEEQATSLATFCAEGPQIDPALCQAACAEIGPCIPIDSESAALRDPVICAQFCITSDMFQEENWSCITRGGQCDDFFACLQNPGPPPDNAACPAYGARAAECTVQSCPNSAGIEVGLADLLSLVCNGQIAQGADPALFQNVEGLACDDERLASYVRLLTLDTPENMDDGSLTLLCTEGPLRDLELCAAGCAQLSPCIPEGNDGELLRDPDICVWYCASNPELPDAGWQCLAEAVDCASAGACTN